MTHANAIARILLLGAAFLLSSCIDSREEYWLQTDGSGRAELTYHLPAGAAAVHGGESGIRQMVTDFLAQTPELTAATCEVATEENRLRVHISTAFESAMDIKDIAAGDSLKALPAAASALIGEIAADLRGRTLDFRRSIAASEALPGAAFLPASQLKGHRMTYIMHLPAAPIESNATRTEDAGRTLVWDIPLAQAVNDPITTRFRMNVPIPWGIVSAIATPVLLAACALVLRFRKSRNHLPGGTR